MYYFPLMYIYVVLMRLCNLFKNSKKYMIKMTSLKSRFIRKISKSLGLIDRKFFEQGENDGFVLCEYIIKQCSTFCKYTHMNVMKEIKEKHILTVNRTSMESHLVSYLIVLDQFQVFNHSYLPQFLNCFQVNCQCMMVYILNHFDIHMHLC